jgi:hypothetical protein
MLLFVCGLVLGWITMWGYVLINEARKSDDKIVRWKGHDDDAA